MILVDHEKRIKLSISGYEFESADGYHDKNWLKVKVDVSDGDLNWVAEDNCLLAYELVRLRDWLKSLTVSSEDEIRFTENELAFRFDREANVLTVVLDFYLHPKGKDYDYGEDGDEEYLLRFQMNTNKLSVLVSDVEKLISLYPVKDEN